MSLGSSANRKVVKVFLLVVCTVILLLYFAFDFYLKSVGNELLLSWVKSEAVSIQEGNLLTSTTKNQRVLLSSDYIKAVKLVKLEKDTVEDRIHFGNAFQISNIEFPMMTSEVVTVRSGFLHYRAFYQIPKRENMFLIFDVQSTLFSYAFLGLVTLFLLMMVILIVSIRAVEKNESLKREKILKQVINDFTSKDKISEIVNQEFPKLSAWWKNKQAQIETAEQLAIRSQNKALMSEIASRVGHDITATMSNIEIITGEMRGLSEKHANALASSIKKVKSIASDILNKTKIVIEDDRSTTSQNDEMSDLNQIILEIISQKNILFDHSVKIQFKSDSENIILKNVSTLDLERSISNIVNNAIEASGNLSEVFIAITSNDKSVEIQVQDSGCGISADNLQKIGVKGFTQGKTNGNGIGIYYAKQFIESLGGKFSIQSIVSQGTTVSMVLFN